ncbi:hypothetical protein EVAR_49697_1 [Eumeta japonica]|uniref:Uncharacterized protein n=1 Tax=Eumeta variegata TaxID=151549 RepID=A0A4C1Z217_EUMVA|nr:hypothetical protein EVAR_49697_1 [Eumeta japonica]
MNRNYYSFEIKTVVMRSWRSMCEVPLKDRYRDSDIRERCGLKEHVVIRVEKGMLLWFGHLDTVNEGRLIYIDQSIKRDKTIERMCVMERSSRVPPENPTQTELVAY